MNAIVPPIVIIDTLSRAVMLTRKARVNWCDEAVETAKRLSAEGKSAGEIAHVMLAEHPSITRNAVIGKLHRLGCAGGGRQSNGDKPSWSSARRAAQIARAKEYPRGATDTARKALSPVNPDQVLRTSPAPIPTNTVADSSDLNSEQQGASKAKAGNDPSVVGEPAFPLLTSRLAPTAPGARVGRGVRIRSEKCAPRIERRAAPRVGKLAFIASEKQTPCPPETGEKFIGIQFVEIEDGLCRWPQGDPLNLNDFRFCGISIDKEALYCPCHELRAFNRSYAKSTERNQWLMKA